MQQNTCKISRYNSHKRQDQIFAVNVHRDFLIVEAKHLDRRQLPHPFGHVDVCQIIQYDKSQCCGGHNQYDHYNIHAIEHILKALPNTTRKAYKRNILKCS
ncbi:hypothetical protein D3C73_1038680 [compost metagenome]